MRVCLGRHRYAPARRRHRRPMIRIADWFCCNTLEWTPKLENKINAEFSGRLFCKIDQKSTMFHVDFKNFLFHEKKKGITFF